MTSTVLNNSIVEGEFIKPTLTFNRKVLNFRYLWDSRHAPEKFSKSLEITNTGNLPINFFLNIDKPFSTDEKPISLNCRKKSRFLCCIY